MLELIPTDMENGTTKRYYNDVMTTSKMMDSISVVKVNKRNSVTQRTSVKKKMSM